MSEYLDTAGIKINKAKQLLDLIANPSPYVTISSDKIVDIADAVRAKVNETDEYLLPQISDKIKIIANIFPGAYDADGNILKTWDELLNDGLFIEDNGLLKSNTNLGIIRYSKTTKVPINTIVIPEGIDTLDSYIFFNSEANTFGNNKFYPKKYVFPNSLQSFNGNNIFSAYITIKVKCSHYNYYMKYRFAIDALCYTHYGNNEGRVYIDLDYDPHPIVNESIRQMPGAYDYNGNLIRSWDQLIADEIVIIENGILTFGNINTEYQNDLIDSISAIICKDNTATIWKHDETHGRTFSGLLELVLPKDLRKIEKSKKISDVLESIWIPSTVTSIETKNTFSYDKCDLFTYTHPMKNIYYKGTAEGAPWGAYDATVITDF